MIDHNVMRLHVSVHNALAVAEVQGFEQFEDVESHIEVVELGVEAPEVGVVDILEDKGRGLTLHGTGLLGILEIIRQESVLTCESRTTSSNATTFGPPARFWRILISRLIFFFLTGFRTLMTHF